MVLGATKDALILLWSDSIREAGLGTVGTDSRAGGN